MHAAIGGFLSWLDVGLPGFLFVITLVVFFHELGHFIAARLCGVRVEIFSIGFGRELAGFTDGRGTRWRISWIPLGGYVKFAGDADASSRPDGKALTAMDESARAGALHFKPLYQRAIVAAAGPVANFILAIVIFGGLTMVSGKLAEPPVIREVMPGSAAEAAGLQAGDAIRSVGGQTIGLFADLQRVVGGSAGHPLHIVVSRAGHDLTFDATPKAEVDVDDSGVKHSIGRLGIRPATVPVGFFEAVTIGASDTWDILAQTSSYLARIATGREGPGQLHGILGIGEVSGEAARMGIMALLSLAGLMSVSIGLVNLLPVPVLDGGHLLYYACEGVLGRPLGEQAQEVGFRLGLAFVFGLMLLATFNDLVRFNLF